MPPYQVIPNPRQPGRPQYAVVDTQGDAELGNWIVAECELAGHADMLADALNTQAAIRAYKRKPAAKRR